MKNMNSAPKLLFSILLCCLFFTSCIQKAYYQGPMVGSTSVYHTMPVASDSQKSATYANAAIGLGGMNERLRDDVFSFQSGFSRSHVLNSWRLNYGASVAVGTYHVDASAPLYPDTVSRIKNTGTKFFGTYGGYASVSAATPLGRRGEWRYIGLEGNLFNEFGSYYTFRKDIPDSAANTIDKKRYMGSLGISTEFVFKRRSQNKFGMKFILGSYLRSLNYFNRDSTYYYTHSHDNLLYFSAIYHATIKKSTAFVQLNFATHTANFQFGFNYRL